MLILGSTGWNFARRSARLTVVEGRDDTMAIKTDICWIGRDSPKREAKS